MFWEENLQPDSEESFKILNEMFDYRSEDIIESILDDMSREVATTISRYVSRKLIKRTKCENRKLSLIGRDIDLTMTHI